MVAVGARAPGSYSAYGTRAQIEERLKDAKLGQALRRMPTADHNANRTWMTAALIALNLTAIVCDLCPAAGASGKAPADTPLLGAVAVEVLDPDGVALGDVGKDEAVAVDGVGLAVGEQRELVGVDRLAPARVEALGDLRGGVRGSLSGTFADARACGEC